MLLNDPQNFISTLSFQQVLFQILLRIDGLHHCSQHQIAKHCIKQELQTPVVFNVTESTQPYEADKQKVS